jgi:uncharacterized membrane protein YfcA
MSYIMLLAVAVAALIGAIVSAITGVAGGVILLTALLATVDPRAVVPIHSVVQLIANGSRLVAYVHHIQWRIVGRFAATVIPGSLIGAWLISLIEPGILQVIIATAILASLLIPDKFPIKEQVAPARWLFYGLGFGNGILGMLVGSTGPLVTIALLYSGVVKERHIATKAACQAFSYTIKIPLFGFAIGFDYMQYAGTIVLLGAAVILGTLVGKRLLTMVSRRAFTSLTRILLAVIAFKLISSSVYM